VLDVDLRMALRERGVVPSLMIDGADLLRIGRRTAAGDLVFLANPEPVPVVVTLTGTSESPPVTWDPVTLRREALPETSGGHRLSLPALGSVFLVPGGPAEPAWQEPAAELPCDGEWRLNLPGVLETVLPQGPRPWTDLGAGAAAFAGTGTYTTDIEVDRELLDGHVAVLALAEVGDLARVRVNGANCGVAWTHPFRIDVTDALRPGRNMVEVAVANAWMNRLIAEAAMPTGETFAPATQVYTPAAPKRPSGLSGPVVVQLFPGPRQAREA
jgi:hypothetical protein